MEIKIRVVNIRVHVKIMLLSDGDDIGGVKDEKQRSRTLPRGTPKSVGDQSD